MPLKRLYSTTLHLLPEITIICAFFAVMTLTADLLVPGVFSLQKTLFFWIALTVFATLATTYYRHHTPIFSQRALSFLMIPLFIAATTLLFFATRGFGIFLQIPLFILMFSLSYLWLRE